MLATSAPSASQPTSIGMIPCEHSSGKRQRLGKLSKEGNALPRSLWSEAVMHAAAKDPELKRFYRRKLIQKGQGKARIAPASQTGRQSPTNH
jgi:transposase